MKAQDEIALIRKQLGHVQAPEKNRLYLDTGSPDFNAALGHRDRGIVWGTIIELFGHESHGKSLTAKTLMRMALEAGAYGIWQDYEDSWDEPWDNIQGLYYHKKPPKGTRRVALIQPYEGTFGKTKKGKHIPDLATCEVMFEETEALIKYRHEKFPDQPIIVVTDSITAMNTDADDAAGVRDRNLTTNMSLPKFLGITLKRWVRMVRVNNVIGVFINQIRINPMQMFGSPEVTPGGKALKFYAHTRCKVKRDSQGGRMIQTGKGQIGVKGIIENVKNKRGQAFEKCTYKYKFNGSAKFGPVSKSEQKEE